MTAKLRLRYRYSPLPNLHFIFLFISSFLEFGNRFIDVHFLPVSESDDKGVFELCRNGAAKNDKRLKGLKNVDYYKEKGIYKYTYGASAEMNPSSIRMLGMALAFRTRNPA